MKIKIVGVVDEDCSYLTSGQVYDVLRSGLNDEVVDVIDDDGDLVTLLTENSDWDCAHLGPNAKAVFVD